jgi:cytochrome c biogenesis protein
MQKLSSMRKESEETHVLWSFIDKLWLQLASVKLTLVVLVALLLLSIPGTLIMQLNISNVDPGSQYDYDFWSLGQRLQLFTAYHSYWYVGLMVLLSMNLIACSTERWPQMWKMANAKPVAWSPSTFDQAAVEFKREWRSDLPKEVALTGYLNILNDKRISPVVVENGPNTFQIFFQKGRWSRIANYLVHTSLLVIFAGAIITALYGFEGAANIPAGSAVDTFILFSEGRHSQLRTPPEESYPRGQKPLVNEKLLGFRLKAQDFRVEFYEKFPGRPKDFISELNIIRQGQVLKSGTIRVNSPMTFEQFTFYQASYGRMGQFDISLAVIPVKKDLKPGDALHANTGLNEIMTFDQVGGLKLTALSAFENFRNLGPAVLVAEIKDNELSGKPFFILKNHPQMDINRGAPYVVVLKDLKEQLFTGLQIGYDPGAPLYWFGCLGLLIGTFYALLVTHRKFYLRFHEGKVVFAGTIHRLPTGFESQIQKFMNDFRALDLKGLGLNSKNKA